MLPDGEALARLASLRLARLRILDRDPPLSADAGLVVLRAKGFGRCGCPDSSRPRAPIRR
jgi:hypothetical protein